MLTILFETVTINGQTFIRLHGVKPAGSTVGVYKVA